MKTTTNAASAENQSRAALLTRSLRWLLVGWGLAAVFALLAFYQSISTVRARNDATLARMEADVARTEAAQLRQQLEAERILARHEIDMLKKGGQ